MKSSVTSPPSHMMNTFHNKPITAHYSPMFSDTSFIFLEVSEWFAENWGCQVGPMSCRDGGWCGVWAPVQSFNSLFINGLYFCIFERRKILPFVNWLIDLNLTNMCLYITVYHLDDTVGASCILSVEISTVLVLLSPAVLSDKGANKKYSFIQTGSYCC